MYNTEKIYHIYARDRCLFHSIKEEEFNTTWSTLKIMVGLMKTEYTIEDLSYEELIFNKLLNPKLAKTLLKGTNAAPKGRPAFNAPTVTLIKG